MSDSEWCRRLEQINWVLKYTAVINLKAEAEEQLIAEDNKMFGIEDE